MNRSTARLITLGLPVVATVFFANFVGLGTDAPPEQQTYFVGVSKVDITPDYPVRLNGYGSRRDEHAGVAQKIYAKALAVNQDGGIPAVIVTVDSLGVRLSMVEEVARRLKAKVGLPRERFALTFSHSHTTPKVNGASDTIFSQAIPPDHQKRIDRYTQELTDWIETAALDALKSRKPSKLSWSVGKVGFAMNRRTKGGPVDHDLPTMVVRDAATDTIRAVYLSYACHCTTLSNNKISGDWSGHAQAEIENDHAGAVCLVSIGCGSDSNPNARTPGDNTDLVSGHGEAIRKEVARLLKKPQTPVAGAISAKLNHIDLPLQKLPTRAQWEELAKKPGATGYSAKWHLDKLGRGEQLMEAIRYPVQTLSFGDDLAMLFLAGEVCVDYSLRLKRELDRDRVWINAYSNDFCSYIPSERLLKEGGYGGGSEMVYFGVPTLLAPGMEKLVIDEVHRQVPKEFSAIEDKKKTGGSRPLSPEESRQRIDVADDLRVELVAAEPLVVDPVAIDFGADGKLWVCEMHDYPDGMDGKSAPGGRIKFLEDVDGDGRYDKSTLFADGLPFPTEVKVWRNGVLVCAAPDVLYLEDSDGDGRADIRKTILTGFATHNYQARVNSIRLGLDNWMYAAVGLFGGEIQSFADKGDKLVLNGRDFRFDPDSGALEAAAGNSQQGRVRDDWGRWFGCTNGSLIKHYPLADHHIRRNPHVQPPPPEQAVPGSTVLFPARPDVQLFKLSGASGKATAACGIGIYRDELLGPQFAGDAFTCEPVNLLVHRSNLAARPNLIGFFADDPADKHDFLASTDRWFRPVQARTGPDGALWVVDMYRFVIEHSRWIPKETLANLDLRAGSERGRIYRVYSKQRPPRPIVRLDRLETASLVQHLDTPNGVVRDLVHQLLLWRDDRDDALALLNAMASDLSKRAVVRLQALCVLDGLNALGEPELLLAMRDSDANLRAQAARLCAPRLESMAALHGAFLDLTRDAVLRVRMEAAAALHDWRSPEAAAALAAMLKANDDPHVLGAAFSSAVPHASALMRSLADEAGDSPPDPNLIAIAVAAGSHEDLFTLAGQLVARNHRASIAGFLKAISRRQPAPANLAAILTRFQAATSSARTTIKKHAGQGGWSPVSQLIPVLAWIPADAEDDLMALAELVRPGIPTSVQSAALRAFGRLQGGAAQGRAAEILIARWSNSTPSIRSLILDTLRMRDTWTDALIRHLKAHPHLCPAIDLPRRESLLAHPDKRLARRAAEIFKSATGDRDRLVANYKSVAELDGDAKGGELVFTMHCAACHRIGDEGLPIGPDLASLSDKSDAALLNGILNPNAAVLDQYVLYAVGMRDGTDLGGIISQETSSSISLTQLDGSSQAILRKDIASMTTTNRSLMPDGLESVISKQSMADLFAYLRQDH